MKILNIISQKLVKIYDGCCFCAGRSFHNLYKSTLLGIINIPTNLLSETLLHAGTKKILTTTKASWAQWTQMTQSGSRAMLLFEMFYY